MKKIFVSGILLTIMAAGFFCTEENKKPTTSTVKELYSSNLNTLLKATDTFENAVKAKREVVLLQQLFKETRNAYKKTELFAEYYNPGTAKAINGPALPDRRSYLSCSVVAGLRTSEVTTASCGSL